MQTAEEREEARSFEIADHIKKTMDLLFWNKLSELECRQLIASFESYVAQFQSGKEPETFSREQIKSLFRDYCFYRNDECGELEFDEWLEQVLEN